MRFSVIVVKYVVYNDFYIIYNELIDKDIFNENPPNIVLVMNI